MKEPKDHTNIVYGPPMTWVSIFYADYINFDNLPDLAKAPETKAEYDAWWKWYREEMKDD